MFSVALSFHLVVLGLGCPSLGVWAGVGNHGREENHFPRFANPHPPTGKPSDISSLLPQLYGALGPRLGAIPQVGCCGSGAYAMGDRMAHLVWAATLGCKMLIGAMGAHFGNT